MQPATKKPRPPRSAAPSSAALEIATRLVESVDGYEASVLREELGREYHTALTELGPKVRFFGSRIYWNG